MQSILRWSIENSTSQDVTTNDNAPVVRKDLDPGIIDHILGKPDSEQMKDDLAVAIDLNKSDEERVEALDHLEMLVEQIDNANDLEGLNLWEPLQSLLIATTSSQGIKSQALWVIGTAVQNNPAAQDAYLAYDPLPVLISFLDPAWSPSSKTRAKAIYVLSGLLRHNAPAVAAFGTPEVNGWPKLRDSLQDPDITVRRKVIFLLGTLLLPATVGTQSNIEGGPNILTPDNRPADPNAQAAPIHANSHAEYLRNPSRLATSQLVLDAICDHQIFEAVSSSLRDPVPHGDDGEHTDLDIDYKEKAVRFVYLYVAKCPVRVAEAQREALSNWVAVARTEGEESELPDRLGLEDEEYEELVHKLVSSTS